MLSAPRMQRRLERRLRLRKKIRRRWFQGSRSNRLREKSSQGLRPRMQWDAWDTSQIKIRAVGSEIDSAPNRPRDVIVPSERSSLRDSDAQIITLPSLLSGAETNGTRGVVGASPTPYSHTRCIQPHQAYRTAEEQTIRARFR